MKRDPGPLPFLLVLGGFLAVTVGVVFIGRHLGWGRATGPRPNRMTPEPPAIALFISRLSQDAPELRFKISKIDDAFHGVRYVLKGDAQPPGVPPEEEYADCYQGVLYCIADAPAGAPDGEHSCHAGDFWLFGDPELMEQVRPIAESVRARPHQATP